MGIDALTARSQSAHIIHDHRASVYDMYTIIIIYK